MPRTAAKQPKRKTGGGLQKSRFIFVFSEAGIVRGLKISCFLLVKSKWRLSWAKCACKNVKILEVIPIKPHGSVSPPFWILTVEWSGARSCLLMTSPFSDSIVFSVHSRKQGFHKASFSNRSTLESVFQWLRFR